ncbi:hypothetical protein B0E37_04221 [Streptomyces sp. MH192]|nr:hypothetical protein [Streptomyces sp. MH192]MCF0102286.1 hypothetical protein [Streptomyces sp. MH191]
MDGRPLHLMRRADGTWVSMVDHYASYPTPLAAARGAVDVLGPGDHLRAPEPAHDGEHVTAGPPARRPRHTTSEDMTRGTSHDM